MEKSTVKRITKAMRYDDIIALLTGEEVKNGTTTDDAVEFIKYEMSLLAKKNNTESKKLTAVQEANIQYRELIMQYLSVQSEPKTCTEIGKNIPEMINFNNQKIAALLKSLVDTGMVVKIEGKGGKKLFSLPQ